MDRACSEALKRTCSLRLAPPSSWAYHISSEQHGSRLSAHAGREVRKVSTKEEPAAQVEGSAGAAKESHQAAAAGKASQQRGLASRGVDHNSPDVGEGI